MLRQNDTFRRSPSKSVKETEIDGESPVFGERKAAIFGLLLSLFVVSVKLWHSNSKLHNPTKWHWSLMTSFFRGLRTASCARKTSHLLRNHHRRWRADVPICLEKRRQIEPLLAARFMRLPDFHVYLDDGFLGLEHTRCLAPEPFVAH